MSTNMNARYKPIIISVKVSAVNINIGRHVLNDKTDTVGMTCQRTLSICGSHRCIPIMAVHCWVDGVVVLVIELRHAVL